MYELPMLGMLGIGKGGCSRSSEPQQLSSHQGLTSHPVDTSDTASAPDSARVRVSNYSHKYFRGTVAAAKNQGVDAYMRHQTEAGFTCSTGNKDNHARNSQEGQKLQHSSLHQTSQPMEEDPPLSGAVATIASMAKATAPAGPFGAFPTQVTHSSSAAATPTDKMSTEHLAQHLEDFIMREAKQMVAQAKKLLPAALEHATKDKIAAIAELKEQYEEAQKQASQATAQTVLKDKMLTEVTAQAESLQQQLSSKDATLRELNIKLSSKDDECVQLKAVLQVKERDLAAVNLAMDDVVAKLQDELEDANSKGKELLTFQGLATPEASTAELHVSIKELCDAADSAAWILSRHAAPMVPHILDLKGVSKQNRVRQQLIHCGLKHAVMSVVSHQIFHAFRTENLIISCSCSCFDSFGATAVDPATTLLKLQLEKKRAMSWLQLMTADKDPTATQRFQDQIVAPAAQAMVQRLLSAQLLKLHTPGSLQSAAADDLLPAVTHVVRAAVKAQVICSAMHSQLIHLFVPGWQQPQGIRGVKLAAAAPSQWARWPGVTPLAKAMMQPAQCLPAVAGVIPRGVEPPAVFCSEPAVLQLAERVGQLPEFGGPAASGVLLQPFKVIRKAKMCVACAK